MFRSPRTSIRISVANLYFKNIFIEIKGLLTYFFDSSKHLTFFSCLVSSKKDILNKTNPAERKKQHEKKNMAPDRVVFFDIQYTGTGICAGGGNCRGKGRGH